MRIIHTSDWHLGHRLSNHPRIEEHQAFLDWLVEQVQQQQPDALLITGDIFHSPSPPASAEQMFYEFLHKVRQCDSHCQVIVLGGNHDSGYRIDAPHRLLRGFHIRMVGGLPTDERGALDMDRLLIPIKNRAGQLEAWIMAVPYLRPSDLPILHPRPDHPLLAGVKQVYGEALALASEKRQPDQALIVTGHCQMAQGIMSEASERRILGGPEEGLPNDIFPEDVTFVALGHLHLPQQVGTDERIRYAGAPLALSVAERKFPHQALLIETRGPRLHSVESLIIPKHVEFIRIPENDSEPLKLDKMLQRLKTLPLADASIPLWKRPFLWLHLELDQPRPGFREQIRELLSDKCPRLIGLKVDNPADTKTLADYVPAQQELDLLEEVDVFVKFYGSKFRDHPEVPPDILDTFRELLDEVRQENS